MKRAPSTFLLRASVAVVLSLSSIVAFAPAQASPSETDETTHSGFLLPLPSADREEATPPRDNSDSVAVDSPENVDEAIALLEQMKEAQALVGSISNTLASARVELESAREMERLALLAAAQAQIPLRETTLKVDQLAARTYMSGGAPAWASVLYAETPEEAIEISTFTAYMQSVSNSHISDADRAKSTSASAQSYAAETIKNRLALEQQVSDLEANLAAAQLTVRSSMQAYQAYITAPAPQTRVGADGCPLEVPAGTLRGGSDSIGVTKLCRKAVAAAPSPQAALAIKTAFSRLGAPYACEGVGRLGAWRFDCSSLVSRAYSESSGIPVAGPGWAPSTRDMIPWDGVSLDPHYVEIPVEDIRPGDLLLYRSCTTPPCSFQHVQMALTDGFILHTNDCGDVAHITMGNGYGPGSNFVVARRVVYIEGENLLPPTVVFPGKPLDPSTFLTKRELEEYLALKPAAGLPATPEAGSDTSD